MEDLAVWRYRQINLVVYFFAVPCDVPRHDARTHECLFLASGEFFIRAIIANGIVPVHSAGAEDVATLVGLINMMPLRKKLISTQAADQAEDDLLNACQEFASAGDQDSVGYPGARLYTLVQGVAGIDLY